MTHVVVQECNECHCRFQVIHIAILNKYVGRDRCGGKIKLGNNLLMLTCIFVS